MSRYRRGGKNGKRQQERPASVLHRQHSSGRLSHWYNHKPVVTVDQLHKYRRKEFGPAAGCGSPPSQPQPPISLSASPSFITEYRDCYEPPYRTAEEMSVNRRHAAVPKDELQVEGETEFSPEYADQFKDMPRARNVAGRQGSHIGPFVCADEGAPEGLAPRSEQTDQYVPHPDGRRADNLRPGTGLRMDQAPMEGETEQTANYRKYPTTPHPDSAPDRNEVTAAAAAAEECPTAGLPSTRRPPMYDEGLKEMILVRDSGMLLRPAAPHPARSFTVVGAPRIERAAGSHVRRPAFRLQVVDCSGGGATDDSGDDGSGDGSGSGYDSDIGSGDGGSGSGDDDGRWTPTDAFVVINRISDRFRLPSAASTGSSGTRSPRPRPIIYAGGRNSAAGNRWVRRRQRKMGTVRFFDDGRRDRLAAAGKTIQ